MRIAIVPADETACGLYRLRYPAGAVRAVRPDWDVKVYRPGDVRLGTDFKGNLVQIQGLPSPDEIDVLVVQRVGNAKELQMLEWMQRQGVAVVVDSDDAMWCIDPENTAYRIWQDQYRWLDLAMDMADLATVTTPHLEKRYGGHGRCEVIPNYVPAEVAELESIRHHWDDTPTIGWAGFTATHPGDLRVVGDAVRQVVEETGCKVRIVGDAEGAMNDWGLRPEQVTQVGPVPIGVPYYIALTSIDIALVPLKDTPFNWGKSWLKAMEFSAMGVPVVATPTPANYALGYEIGMDLPRSPEEWYAALIVLVENRGTIGADNRESVLSRLTYEGNAERWALAWERAAKRRERLSA